MHKGILHESNKSSEKEEVPSWMLDFAERLLAFCSSSHASKLKS